MANLLSIKAAATALCLCITTTGYAASIAYYPGLPTRSQDPLLQSYFIPAAPLTSAQDWTFSQSLYITNTYQQEDSSTETALIDVENTRVDLQATYRFDPWYFNINLPYITNRSGYLDQTIRNWHDFFQLPQGGRDQRINNQLKLLYQKNGISVLDLEQSDSGLGDIQFALGRQLTPSTQLWIALEIALADSSLLISNDAIDGALWISGSLSTFSASTAYYSAGVAFPANTGLFKGLIEQQFGFAQLGLLMPYNADVQFQLQTDYHSPIVRDSALKTFDHSLQAQFVLRLPRLVENSTLELFFSEDILPGHAPDITFGLRFSSSANN
ncbi:MAG: DUF3187 family protein [Gammaproteobacteria bacterium]|nr:DUF3187 family protein [Gammaproteobacteria bacterium]MBL7000256.1 DUF3187 family protein [Gammaproteobacteria bacterium]